MQVQSMFLVLARGWGSTEAGDSPNSLILHLTWPENVDCNSRNRVRFQTKYKGTVKPTRNSYIKDTYFPNSCVFINICVVIPSMSDNMDAPAMYGLTSS